MTSHGIQIIADDQADRDSRRSSAILKSQHQQKTGTAESSGSNTTSTTNPGGSNKKFKMRFNLVLALGILLGLIGASLLVAFGLWYVKPYMKVRDMQGTECTTHVTFSINDLVKCTCAPDGSSSCLSQYPCLKVWVNLTTQSGQVLDNITLYDSYETFQFQQPTKQCSYHKCSRIPAQNLAAVESFAEKYGRRGERFWCHYRPSSPTYAILDIITAWTVVHCMLWPSVALVTGLTILIVHLNIDSAKSKRKTSHFNSLERPWLRHADRNYEKVQSDT